MLQGLNQGAVVEELAPSPWPYSMPQDLNVQARCLHHVACCLARTPDLRPS